MERRAVGPGRAARCVVTQNLFSAVMQRRSEPHDSPSTPAEARARGFLWCFAGDPYLNPHIAKLRAAATPVAPAPQQEGFDL